MDESEITQRAADAVSAKLQQLYDSLSDREKAVFAQILVQATRPEEVAGFGTAGPAVSLNLTKPGPGGTRLRILLPTKPSRIVMPCG